jgi:hypothetical protein
MSSPPIVRIDVWEMRCRFNKGRFWERVQAGELNAIVNRSKHPAPPQAGQVHCTSSQEVSYHDAANREVARVHQYLRQDNTLGGKGRPDPKRLLEDGVLYRLQSPPEQTPETVETRVSRLGKKIGFRWMTIWGPIRCRFWGR